MSRPYPDQAGLPRRRHQALRKGAAEIRRTLRERPDSEHEMTLNRLAFSGLVFAYMVLGSWIGVAHARAMFAATYLYFLIYFLTSIGLFCHILYRPGVSVRRRLLAIVHDLAMISYTAVAGGIETGLFYPLYLWTIFGNGFRFGVPYIYASMMVAVAGFASVLAVTGLWAEYHGLSMALLGGLVILPLYVSRLIHKLSDAKRLAEEASRAKSLFLASVTHELRTPLNAIIGLSSLLKDQALGREQAEMVQVIGASGQSLLRLINSILDLSRAEAGRMQNAVAEFDLFATLHRIRAMLDVQARSKGLRLALHIAPRSPQYLVGDLRCLEEVLLNLAGNAVKFTKTGHVVIGVDALRTDGHCVRLRFEVVDTGIGIAPEAQKVIFESFTQADETILDRFGGTGLGLAICKQLVELHGGQIGVESRPGSGSTFWFEIAFQHGPRAVEDAPGQMRPALVWSTDRALQACFAELEAPVRWAATWAEAEAQLAAFRTEGADHMSVVIDSRAAGEIGQAATAAWIVENAGRDASFILVTEEHGHGMLPGAARSLYASAVGRSCDAGTLAAALRIAASSAGIGGGAQAAKPPAAASSNSLAVLVAEDNRTNQMVIRKILERAGHVVTVVEDGEAAIETLHEGEFDVVLMDVNMPVMNGIEATKLYRFAALGRRRVPIIALTADATEESRARCEAAGMDACATKPIEPGRLLEIIHRLAQESKPSPAETAPRTCGPADGAQDAPAAPQPVDLSALQDLEELGGAPFVVQLVEQFLSDATGLLRHLARAAAESDVQVFRDQAHALHSCAANVGARRLAQMCHGWRRISSRELAAEGARHLARLGAEFATVRAVLEARVAQGPDK